MSPLLAPVPIARPIARRTSRTRRDIMRLAIALFLSFQRPPQVEESVEIGRAGQSSATHPTGLVDPSFLAVAWHNIHDVGDVLLHLGANGAAEVDRVRSFREWIK